MLLFGAFSCHGPNIASRQNKTPRTTVAYQQHTTCVLLQFDYHELYHKQHDICARRPVDEHHFLNLLLGGAHGGSTTLLDLDTLGLLLLDALGEQLSVLGL